MGKKPGKKPRCEKFVFRFLALLLVFHFSGFSQTKSNLTIILNLHTDQSLNWTKNDVLFLISIMHIFFMHYSFLYVRSILIFI